MIRAPGQRWMRTNVGPSVLLVEVVKTISTDTIMGKIITSTFGHKVGDVLECSNLPHITSKNEYWEYLEGQDAP